MSRLTRDGTAEPVSREQILRRERRQGNIVFPCSADHVQGWQPYPVDPYSCYMCNDTYMYYFLYRGDHCRVGMTEFLGPIGGLCLRVFPSARKYSRVPERTRYTATTKSNAFPSHHGALLLLYRRDNFNCHSSSPRVGAYLGIRSSPFAQAVEGEAFLQRYPFFVKDVQAFNLKQAQYSRSHHPARGAGNMSAKPLGGEGAMHAQNREEKVGLLRKVAPVHAGPLRRRTRFFKALHYFEIRSSVLLLYKSRKRTSNPGFLESLFSKTIEGDVIDSEIVQAASSQGQWDAAFDMSGAKITVFSPDEKGGSFPFRITFEGIFILSVSVVDSCDKDSPQRSLYLMAPTAESR